jgi:hypothetical protein
VAELLLVVCLGLPAGGAWLPSAAGDTSSSGSGSGCSAGGLLGSGGGCTLGSGQSLTSGWHWRSRSPIPAKLGREAGSAAQLSSHSRRQGGGQLGGMAGRRPSLAHSGTAERWRQAARTHAHTHHRQCTDGSVALAAS